MIAQQTVLQRTILLILLMVPIILLLDSYLSLSEWSRDMAIQKLQSKGLAVAPSMSPLAYLMMNSLTRDLLPLSGIADVTTVVCKEEEEELIYKSDQFGFNNPNKRWSESEVDVAFLGDSYVQGYCVKPADHFISLVEKSMTVLNLGLFGSGPLSELAILMEYAALRKPNLVVWAYMANDLSEDLPIEASHSILHKYLAGTKQNLWSRKSEVTQLQTQILNEAKAPLRPPSIKSVFSLMALRTSLLNWILKKTRSPYLSTSSSTDYLSSETIDWLLYLHILKIAQKTVAKWGGELVFLYLPEAGHWHPQQQAKSEKFKTKLFSIVQEANIRVLDFTPVLKVKISNPLEGYSVFSGQYGHYNSQGQKILAEFLTDRLKVFGPKKHL